MAKRKKKRTYKQYDFQPLPGEYFRALPGWRGFYAVSNLGRVKNVKTRKIITPTKRKNTDGNGYIWRVDLYRDGCRLHYNLGELVLRTFDGPRGENEVPVYLNGNRDDNTLKNLVWGSRTLAHECRKEAKNG